MPAESASSSQGLLGQSPDRYGRKPLIQKPPFLGARAVEETNRQNLSIEVG
jgi:hypothetical protein